MRRRGHDCDGLLDLVCHFDTQETGLRPRNTGGFLKFQTVDGTLIEGRDSVKIIPNVPVRDGAEPMTAHQRGRP